MSATQPQLPLIREQYLGFLRRLAGDQVSANPLNLTEWEHYFLASFQQAGNAELWLTENRAKAVDRMWHKYGAELAHPHPSDHVPAAAPDARTEPSPDACMYFVKDEGRRVRCGLPATFMRQNGFRYCDAHAQEAKEGCRKAGQKITLLPYLP